MRCPVCGGRPAHVYKCNACGEIRCGQDTCKGSKANSPGWAGAGSMCRNCGEGRYSVLGFFSKELDDLRRKNKIEDDEQKY
ncbi:MAG: hypothetical protein HQL51_16975 [Magnetococcales bacterium]|nr:hypothetical protein [Magnetococcales bacterium]